MSQSDLLRQKKFAPLFGTLFLGAFNDHIFKNSLVFLVTYQSVQVFGMSPAQAITVASGLFVLPFFLFSGMAGQLADKYDKAFLIRRIKFCEILVMGLAAVGFYFGWYEYQLFVLFLMGLQSTFYSPVKYSILPQHLDPKELVGGNALVEAGTFLAILLGTLGGAVVRISDQGILLICIIVLGLAVAGFIASLFVPDAPANDPRLRLSRNPVTPTWNILKFTAENKIVLLSIFGISWFWFLGAAILMLLPEYAKSDLQVDEWVLSVFLLAFTVGVGIGSLACEALSQRRLEIGLVPFGSIGMTIFLALMGLYGIPEFLKTGHENLMTLSTFLSHAEGIYFICVLFLLAVFSGFYIVPLNTLIQIKSERAHLSRIIAGNNIINAGFTVGASFIVFGLLWLKFSVSQIMLLFAAITVFITVFIYNTVPEFLYRFVVWVISSLLYRVKVTGYENLPDEGGAILVCNHVTFVDWMVIGGAIKRPVRFIMTYKFFKGWLLKRILKKAKVIPIGPKHSHEQIYHEAFAAAAKELRSGELVCIFPEGKLTADGEISEFKPGVEKMVHETPVSVIPMALKNMWGSFFSVEGKGAFRGPKKLWACVELQIGKPIPPEAVKAHDLETQIKEMRGSVS